MAVDLRRVVQNAGRLILEKVRTMMCKVLLCVYAETRATLTWRTMRMVLGDNK